jgi:hypothetical protein
MKARYFAPLVAHVVVTLVIGFGYIIPRSCIAGVNDLTIGFAASVASTVIAYAVGIRMVARSTVTDRR